jgi:hypothetical protein
MPSGRRHSGQFSGLLIDLLSALGGFTVSSKTLQASSLRQTIFRRTGSEIIYLWFIL